MLKSLRSRQNDVFLEMLRSRREELQLRQRDLANKLGRGQAIVSKVEAGTRRLDVIELRTWLRALDVDFVAFIEELEQRLGKNTAAETPLLSRKSVLPSPRRHAEGNLRRRTTRP
jgi:transcriptional regulator with XRE-family HTH domain